MLQLVLHTASDHQMLHMLDYNIFSFDPIAAMDLKSCNSLSRKFPEIIFLSHQRAKVRFNERNKCTCKYVP